METILPLLSLIVGLIAGWFIAVYFLKKTMIYKSEFDTLKREKEIADYKLTTSDDLLQKNEDELKEQKIQTEFLSNNLSELKEKTASLKTNLENKERETEELKNEIREFSESVEFLNKNIAQLNAEKISSEEKNKNLTEKLETQKAELEDIGKKFSNEFKVLANSILEEKSKRFTEQNQTNIKILLMNKKNNNTRLM